jgi:hypothetical protein
VRAHGSSNPDRRPRSVLLEVWSRGAGSGDVAQKRVEAALDSGLALLEEEFGPYLVVVRHHSDRVPQGGLIIQLDGEEIWHGDCPDGRVIRLAVGSALALSSEVSSLVTEAARECIDRGLPAGCWQDGLLEWLTRDEEQS